MMAHAAAADAAGACGAARWCCAAPDVGGACKVHAAWPPDDAWAIPPDDVDERPRWWLQAAAGWKHAVRAERAARRRAERAARRRAERAAAADAPDVQPAARLRLVRGGRA